MIYEAMNQAFYGFDTAVYTFVGNHQTVFLNHLNWFFTFFGGDPVAYFLMALGLVLCFPKKSRKYGMTLLIAVFLSCFVVRRWNRFRRSAFMQTQKLDRRMAAAAIIGLRDQPSRPV